MIKNKTLKNALSLFFVAILCFTLLGISIGAISSQQKGGDLEVVVGKESTSSESSSSSTSSTPSSLVEIVEKTTSNIVKLPATGSNNLLILSFLVLGSLFLLMYFLSQYIDKIKPKTAKVRSDKDETN